MDSLDGLRTFVSTVEAGSFTAAADRLGISKKLASKYVAELENRLGVKLLQRTTRTLSLTSAGQKYYPRCVALLAEFEAMSAELREDDVGLSGTIRISAPVTFGELYLEADLARFRKKHPDLAIDLRLNDRYVDLVSEGFELALRIGSLEDSSLVSRRLNVTDLIAVATPHYLERNGRPQHPSQLVDHNCIRDSNFRAGTHWPFQINGQDQKIAVNGTLMVNSTTSVRNAVMRHEGIGLCPSYAVSEHIQRGALEHVLVDFASSQLGIQLVFTDARRLPKRTRALIDFLVDSYKTAPWQRSGSDS